MKLENFQFTHVYSNFYAIQTAILYTSFQIKILKKKNFHNSYKWQHNGIEFQQQKIILIFNHGIPIITLKTLIRVHKKRKQTS